MRVLGIETSCDETGIAIYDSEHGLLGHAIYTQTDIHEKWGGVVPELASRDHVRKVIPMIEETLNKVGLQGQDLDGIAYTAGPGLVGALLVGTMIARTLGWAWNIPTIGVHHLEGHLLAPFLEPTPPKFPFIALLVSGGHTQLVKVTNVGNYDIIGDTLDDAAGEAFDKTAKLLGLPYPGGALLSAMADKGNAKRFPFPRPMTDRPGLDFSYSGLKTFASKVIKENTLDEQTQADIAAGFQSAVVDTLIFKCRRALRETGMRQLVVAGGVGANKLLRQLLQKMVAEENASVYFPRLEFCTDNGAMIAYAGCQRLLAGEKDQGDIKVDPRWSLQSLSEAHSKK